jgi:hypothetical protein
MVLWFVFISIIIIIILYICNKKDLSKKWDRIEKLNKGQGITRENTYIDKRGYLRWKRNNKLCHRDIAWEKGLRNKKAKFGKCDVHHKDHNKLNNNLANLEVLTRREHKIRHGYILKINNSEFIRLCRISKVYRETGKAYNIAHKWIPKSQCVLKNGYIYIIEWMYKKKFGKD